MRLAAFRLRHVIWLLAWRNGSNLIRSTTPCHPVIIHSISRWSLGKTGPLIKSKTTMPPKGQPRPATKLPLALKPSHSWRSFGHWSGLQRVRSFRNVRFVPSHLRYMATSLRLANTSSQCSSLIDQSSDHCVAYETESWDSTGTNYLATAKKREYDPTMSRDLKDVQLKGGKRTVKPKKSGWGQGMAVVNGMVNDEELIEGHVD
jgi:hypothetical protein